MEQSTVTFDEISPQESWDIFDQAARRILDMSGEDLVREWDAGNLEDQKTPDLMRVLMLRPGGR